MSPRKKKDRRKRKPRRREIAHDELRAILERARTGPLSTEDVEQLSAAVDTLAFLTQELEAEGATVARLRRMLFGPRSEKTKDVLAGVPGTDDRAEEGR